MAVVIVNFRSPFPPHQTIVQANASKVSYGFMLLRPNTATFQLPRSMPNLNDFRQYMGIGAMVTIERDDGLLPWVGMVTKISANSAASMVQYTLHDHAGALFTRSRTPSQWRPYTGSAANILERLFRNVNDRARPPLLVEFTAEPGGPTLVYEPRAETFLDVLNTMVDFTGYEWELQHVIDGEPVTTLRWTSQVGQDFSGTQTWEQGIHFTDVEYTQDADGFFASGIAVGGEGDFRDRPSVAVDVSGEGERSIPDVRGTPFGRRFGVPVGVGQFGRREGVPVGTVQFGGRIGRPVGQGGVLDVDNPTKSGTRTIIERQVTGHEALFAAANKLFNRPDQVAEQLSFSIAESEVDIEYVALGNIVTVRLNNVDLGAGLSRTVRIIGLQVTPETGIIQVESEILRIDASTGTQLFHAKE